MTFGTRAGLTIDDLSGDSVDLNAEALDKSVEAVNYATIDARQKVEGYQFTRVSRLVQSTGQNRPGAAWKHLSAPKRKASG